MAITEDMVGEVQAVLTPAARWQRDLAVVLRRYGFFGLDVDEGRGSLSSTLAVINALHDNDQRCSESLCAIFVEQADGIDLPNLHVKDETGGQLHFSSKRGFFRRPAAYRALLPHVSFSGDVVPIWQTAKGRTVLGWWEWRGRRYLLVGLRVVEELVRYTQGDPARASHSGNRNLWGASHEQPAYLYEGQVAAGHELEPWADRLGYALSELLANMSGIPLVCPLPRGSSGAVMITGDDDQAWLEK